MSNGTPGCWKWSENESYQWNFFDVYCVSGPRHTMTWNNTWIHTAPTHFTIVRRKGVIFHVVVLMGFVDIMTRYVSSHWFYYLEKKKLWGWTLHPKQKCIFIKLSVLSLFLLIFLQCHFDNIIILASRHTCSMRTVSFQNWTTLLKLFNMPVDSFLRSVLACPRMSMRMCIAIIISLLKRTEQASVSA